MVPAQTPFPILHSQRVAELCPAPALRRSRSSAAPCPGRGARLQAHPAPRCHHLLKVSATNPGQTLPTPSPGTRHLRSPDPQLPGQLQLPIPTHPLHLLQDSEHATAAIPG